ITSNFHRKHKYIVKHNKSNMIACLERNGVRSDFIRNDMMNICYMKSDKVQNSDFRRYVLELYQGFVFPDTFLQLEAKLEKLTLRKIFLLEQKMVRNAKDEQELYEIESQIKKAKEFHKKVKEETTSCDVSIRHVKRSNPPPYTCRVLQLMNDSGIKVYPIIYFDYLFFILERLIQKRRRIIPDIPKYIRGFPALMLFTGQLNEPYHFQVM
ncbi:MAG: hypothetical protein AAGE99_05120, partial [Chlamydiota bacterium]